MSESLNSWHHFSIFHLTVPNKKNSQVKLYIVLNSIVHSNRDENETSTFSLQFYTCFFSQRIISLITKPTHSKAYYIINNSKISNPFRQNPNRPVKTCSRARGIPPQCVEVEWLALFTPAKVRIHMQCLRSSHKI